MSLAGGGSRAASSQQWFEQQIGSITGFVGVSTQPIFPQLTSALHPMPIADRGLMVLLKAS
jgi:hypothetical protein